LNVNAKNAYGETALFKACKTGKLEIVKYLIKQGIDINAKDENGLTVLFFAYKKKNLEIVKYLTKLFDAGYKKSLKLNNFLIENEEHGTDINAKNEFGETILFNACFEGDLDIVKYLVEEKKLDIDVKDKNGLSPLFSAVITACCFNEKIDIVKYLVEHGADINTKSNKGETVLFFCFYNGGFIELVKYFISKGLDINVRNNEGKTELWYAKQSKNKEIIEYLKSIGAKE